MKGMFHLEIPSQNLVMRYKLQKILIVYVKVKFGFLCKKNPTLLQGLDFFLHRIGIHFFFCNSLKIFIAFPKKIESSSLF